MVDRIRTPSPEQREVGGGWDRARIVESLKQGNIHEILSKLPDGVSIKDIHNYLREQGQVFARDIYPMEQMVAMPGQMPPPDPRLFSPHHPDTPLSEGERTALRSGLLNAAKAIALKASDGDGETGADRNTPMTAEELEAAASGTLQDYQRFMSDVMGQIIDAQMRADYQKKLGELQQELSKIIMLAKRGDINPEFVLIALAKVNALKNGVLMAGIGKKIKHANEEMNRITEELTASGGDNFAQMQSAQNETRQVSMQMTMLTSDLQNVFQNTGAVIDQVKTMMDEIVRTRREILGRVGGQGA